jgi:thiosulfate/3-mercaptopyruvate sulfurtransferase
MKKLKVKIFSFIFGFSAYAAEPLVDAQWLGNNLNNSKIFILDIRNIIDQGSYDNFIKGHIPGSIHSHYLQDKWRTTVDGIIEQLPPIKHLEQLIGNLGIGNKNHVIIVYGGANSTDFGSAARVYWTFKTLGHDKVSILNGGHKGWEYQGFKIQIGDHSPRPVKFIAKFNDKYFANAGDVIKAIENNSIGLVDSRPADYFVGVKKKTKL